MWQDVLESSAAVNNRLGADWIEGTFGRQCHRLMILPFTDFGLHEGCYPQVNGQMFVIGLFQFWLGIETRFIESLLWL